jgi:hypothetical protein
MLFEGMFSLFCSMPYPNDLDFYQWNVSYFESCFAYVRANNIKTKDTLLDDKSIIFYCLFITENPELFWPIKVNVAKQYKAFFLTDPLLNHIRVNIDKAVRLWPTTEGQKEWNELRKLCWQDWKEATWLDETKFDEFGKPFDSERQ